MEGRLPHAGRAIRADSYVLWTDKLTGHLPNDDEYHLPTASDAWKVLHLHG